MRHPHRPGQAGGDRPWRRSARWWSYYAAANARTLAQKAGVEMPISQAAYEVLYEGRDPKLVVTD